MEQFKLTTELGTIRSFKTWNNSIKKNVLFTPSEKFEKLIEINPSLEILRKKLDLIDDKLLNLLKNNIIQSSMHSITSMIY